MNKKESNRIRAGGIVLRDDALLVMFRRKNGREYHTFPGGEVEEEESPERAVAREIKEETTIDIDVLELLYELNRPGELPQEFFYRCVYKSGAPRLASDSIEQKLNDREKNFFEPKWIKLSEIGDIPLLPSEVAEQLFYDLEHGFKNAPVILDGAPIKE